MGAIGAKTIAVRTNISKRTEIESMLNAVTGALGPVDVLVNNRGLAFTPTR